MPDLYDPYRAYDESDPLHLEDEDFGGVGTAILLTIASLALVPVLAGIRVYDWARDRRKLGKDVHKLLGR